MRGMVKFLTCAGCETSSPPGESVAETDARAEAAGWLVGLRGSRHVPGWQDDWCPKCRVDHERVYCTSRYRSGGPCKSRASFRVTRGDDEVLVCGTHRPFVETEMLLGGKREDGIRVFMVD
jgi:hypothetical protein